MGESSLQSVEVFLKHEHALRVTKWSLSWR